MVATLPLCQYFDASSQPALILSAPADFKAGDGCHLLKTVYQNKPMEHILHSRAIFDALDADTTAGYERFIRDIWNASSPEEDGAEQLPGERTSAVAEPIKLSITFIPAYSSSSLNPLLSGDFTGTRLKVNTPDLSTSGLLSRWLIVVHGLMTVPQRPDLRQTVSDPPQDDLPLYIRNPLCFSPSIMQTEVCQLLLNHPWHTTPLGPISTWGKSLRSAVSMCLGNTFQCSLWWGPEYTLIYNQEYIKVAGHKHPKLFGMSGAHGWREIWPELTPSASRVRQGFTESYEDNLLVMSRQSFKDQSSNEETWQQEETYNSWIYQPMIGDDGQVEGILNQNVETTKKVLAERRLDLLRNLMQKTLTCRTTLDFFQKIADALSSNPLDIPWAMLYSCEALGDYSGTSKGTTEDPGNDSSTSSKIDLSAASALRLRLRSSFGVPAGHSSMPERFIAPMDTTPTSMDTTPTQILGVGGFALPIQQACQTGQVVHTRLLPAAVEGFEKRSWNEDTSALACCPILQSGQPEAMLILGLNTRRPFDDDYREWLEVITNTMSTTLTTVRSIEQEVRRTEELRKLDRAKTNFFQNISHELRTPLTLITGPAVDGGRDPSNNQENKGRFKLISSASFRLLRLVNSLLDFSALEAGRWQTQYQAVQLNTFTEDLASLFRSAIEKGGIKFNVLVNPEEGLKDDGICWLDPSCYEKMLYNLLSNAFKYTKEGSITLSLTSEDSDFVLAVTDTGIGIPQEQLTQVLQRFHRVDSAEGRSIEGTGIGLALVNELVKLHRGTLSVTSQLSAPGKPGGSTFTIRLRSGNSHLGGSRLDVDAPVLTRTEGVFSRRGIADDTSNWAAGESEDDSNSSVGDNTVHGLATGNQEALVLLADDNVDVRTYIKSILAPACRSIVTVSDGQAAWNYLISEKRRPDLVISDIMMPRMDGWGLLREIRAHENTSKIPVILLSARSGAEASAEGVEKGATDYLSKPFSSRELLARVNTQLSNARNSNRLEQLVAHRTQELGDSERRASILVTASPVGLFEASANGLIHYANHKCKLFSNYNGDVPFRFDDWLQNVALDYRDLVTEAWNRTLPEDAAGVESSVKPAEASVELSWIHGGWALLETFPLETGGMIGALTNLTQAKELDQQQLQLERKRADDAQRLARNQEAFVDVVSHELRNPLSCILNSADLTVDTFSNLHKIFEDLLSTRSPEKIQSLLRQAEEDLQEGSEAAQAIILCARHQSIIAGDILSSSRLDQGLLGVAPIDFPLIENIRGTVGMFEIQANSNNIALNVTFGPGIHPQLAVKADPTRLAQVLVNLISNTCRILENWGGERSCNIEIYAVPSRPSISIVHSSPTSPVFSSLPSIPADLPEGASLYLCFIVRDSGPGISAQEQNRLFTKFNRLDENREASLRGGGSGLGLYLARKLAELQHGEITVRSREGEGAEFIFFIQAIRGIYTENKRVFRGKASRIQIRTLDSDESASTPPPTKIVGSREPLAEPSYSTEPQPLSTLHSFPLLTTKAFSRQDIRVLVVEDNLLNQRLLQRQLTKSGYMVEVASNGLEALNLLLKAAASGDFSAMPDVALMDIEMPVMGGLECIEQIRQRETSGTLPKRIRCYGVTGNARQYFIDTAIAAGMDFVFTKPYAFVEIVAKIDSERTD